MDIVPVVYKFVDAAISHFSLITKLEVNVGIVKDRNEGQETKINAAFYEPLLFPFFDSDRWLRRLVTLSEYGTIVSIDKISDMIGKYANLFSAKEPMTEFDPRVYQLTTGNTPTFASYTTLIDPLVVKWEALQAAPNDTTKTLQRMDFDTV